MPARLLVAVLLSCFSAAALAEDFTSPAGAGSAQPHLAATANGSLLLSWTEPAKDGASALRFATLTNGKWSAAKTIVTRKDFFINWADFPSIAADEKGVLYTHWLQKSADGGKYAYDVWIATSRDNGATWSAPRVLHADGKKSEHGFVSLEPLPGGGMGALWLDGREMGGGEGHDAHGEMQARFAKIAADGSIGEETLLDSRVCECCSTGMTLAKSGLIAVYRDRSPEEIRDIAFVRQVDGAWTKPAVVAPDNWKITGCPVNGPRIDSHEQFVGAAWFTGSEDKPKVRVAFSPNSGRSWTAPMQIDSGAPIGRVDLLMLEDNTAMVTWVEATGSSAKIVTRRVMNGGWNGPVTTIATTATARASGFPRSASTGDHAYFAWTDPASKKVKVARLALK